MATGVEIERKFIIKLPKDEIMKRMPGYTRSEILQIYLENTKDGATHRIRRRTYMGIPSEFTENIKRRIDGMSVVEWETDITAGKFNALSAKMKKGSSPVYKTRHTVEFGGRTLEIDVYPKWKKTCIMEVELEERTDDVIFPDFIEIVAEVTGDKAYSNHAMSMEFPEETVV
jgi:CYTH domain-containing protein